MPSPMLNAQSGAETPELTLLPRESYVPRPLMLACPHPGPYATPLFPAVDYVTGEKFELAQCHACGFTVTRPQPSAGQMARYYPASYYGVSAGRRFPDVVERLQDVLYRRRVRRVHRLNGGQPGRVLDIGCGRGFLLRAFQRRGWEVQGTELSEQAAEYARRTLNLPVQIGSLEELRYADAQFDAAVMWHVLEHVPDPRGMVAEVQRLLKPGGVFLLAVPNFASLEARLTRNKWFHLDVPRHLTHFTPRALRQTLEAAGFEVRHTSGLAPEYDSFSFVQSWLNRLGIRHNLLYQMLRTPGARMPGMRGVSPFHVLLSVLLAPLLGVVSLPATLAAAWLGSGATMTLYLRKRAP